MTPRSATDDGMRPIAGLQRRLVLAGAAGAIVSLAGLALDTTQFLQSYLMGYMFCLGLTLGCLALAMMHELSGGAWGTVIRRFTGAAAGVLPVMTLLFLPIALGSLRLYPWTDAALVAQDSALQHKRPYLNLPFFLIRAAVYFAVWNVVSFFFNAWSLEERRSGDRRAARKAQLLGAGGLVAYGLTITFASFDWLMSLEPHWFSTIYGVLVMGGQALTALAFLVIVLAWLGDRPPLDRVLSPAHFHDLGNLLLAFVMLWAYFSFSQYLIIWSGNLPSEIAWYLHRLHTSWQLVGIALVLFHFMVPFVLLLSRTVKRERRLLLRVAAMVLVVRMVDLFWLIAPEFHPAGVVVSWLDVVLPLTLASLWLSVFLGRLRAVPVGAWP